MGGGTAFETRLPVRACGFDSHSLRLPQCAGATAASAASPPERCTVALKLLPAPRNRPTHTSTGHCGERPRPGRDIACKVSAPPGIIGRMNPFGMGVDPSAASTALAWVEAARRQDISWLWPITAPQFRLALVQFWMEDNPHLWEPKERDHVAAELVDGTHPFAPRFQVALTKELRRLTAGIQDWTLVAGSNARPVSPEIELVLVMAQENLPTGALEAGATTPAVSVPVTLTSDGWLVAGWNGVAEPDWPPVIHPVDPTLTE